MCVNCFQDRDTCPIHVRKLLIRYQPSLCVCHLKEEGTHREGHSFLDRKFRVKQSLQTVIWECLRVPHGIYWILEYSSKEKNPVNELDIG